MTKKKETRYQNITQLCSMLRMSWARSAYPFIVIYRSDKGFGYALWINPSGGKKTEARGGKRKNRGGTEVLGGKQRRGEQCNRELESIGCMEAMSSRSFL